MCLCLSVCVCGALNIWRQDLQHCLCMPEMLSLAAGSPAASCFSKISTTGIKSTSDDLVQQHSLCGDHLVS